MSPREQAFWRKAARHFQGREFNQQQTEAIRAPDGPVLIEAGPGSGKTTVLTWRIIYLLDVRGATPGKIRVVTFTKAAADQLKDRVSRLAGGPRGQGVQASTIHSMALQILRASGRLAGRRVIGEGQSVRKVAELIRTFNVPDVDDDTPKQVLTEIGRARNLMLRPESHPSETLDQATFVRLAGAYRDWKKENKLLDFDDILVHLYVMLGQNPQAFHGWCSHLLVDEFQDTSPLQYAILKTLAAPHNNFLVVGDIDQAIYSWRGAGPEVMLQFPKDYPDASRLALPLNYRARERLVEVTNRLIAHNQRRFPTRVRWTKPGGTGPRVIVSSDDAGEARTVAQVLKDAHGRKVPWKEMAVIYRSNYQALPFIAQLAREGIPFRILGDPPNPFRHWVGQDILSYLRLSLGAVEAPLLERIIYRPNRYISRAATEAAGRALRREGSVAKAYEAAGVGLNRDQEAEVSRLDRHLREIARQPTAAQAIRFIREVANYDDYVNTRADGPAGGAVEAGAVLALLELFGEDCTQLDVFVQRGMALAEATEGWWDAAALSFGGSAGPPGTGGGAVALTTCHSAKGLEFDLVVVAGLVEGAMPAKDGDIEEERRLCYVAMTRAREELVLSVPQQLSGTPRQPSRFLHEALPGEPGAAGWEGAAERPSIRLEAGDRIRHILFGEGLVIDPGPGMAEVVFPGVGRKKLDLALCAERGLIRRLG